MDQTLEAIQMISEVRLNLEVLKIVSSIVGMLGGFLGLLVYIDNYILKFKPKFNISNKLYLKFSKSKNEPFVRGRDLESLTIKMEIINERNKLGRIDDFAVRIYNSSSTSPSATILYPESIYENFSKEGIKNGDLFSPITVLGRSNSNLTIGFQPRKHHSSLIVPNSSINMELLYFRNGKGWKVIGSYSPHNFSQDDNDFDDVTEFSLLDTEVSREAVKEVLDKPTVGIYNGVSGRYLYGYLLKPYYWFKSKAKYLVSIFELAYSLFILLVRSLFNKYVILPVIKSKSQSMPRMRWTSLRSHLVSDTDSAIKQCKKHLEIIITEINETADSQARIFVREEANGQYIISRGKFEIKMYKGGDGFIGINDTNGIPFQYSFRMKLIEFPFGIKLWEFNGKVMSLESACVRIMDSFILLSH